MPESESNRVYPPDEYLSADQIQQLREMLDKQIQLLMDSSNNTVNHLTSTEGMAPDALDIAASESSRDFSLRLAGRERLMLRKIRYAFQRIEEGEYGSCETCGEAITFKRLVVRPVATECIDCKTQAEQLERRSRTV